MSDTQIRLVTVRFQPGDELACECPVSLAVHVNDHAVIQLDEAQEYGQITAIGEPRASPETPCARTPRVLRLATLLDTSHHEERKHRAHMALQRCRAAVTEDKLDIRIVSVRFSLDGSRLHVVFSAANRVDLRNMARRIGSELHTRVDVRQIGIRDEAARIGGLGPCGRRICCCLWLKSFESVNVKMAKVQGLSLNPASIAGMCGRLKCCLRFEHETYRALDERAPREGGAVHTPSGPGRVTERDLLQGKIRVLLNDGRLLDFQVDEITHIPGERRNEFNKGARHSTAQRPKPQPSGEEGTDDLWAPDS